MVNEFSESFIGKMLFVDKHGVRIDDIHSRYNIPGGLWPAASISHDLDARIYIFGERIIREENSKIWLESI